jgi:hypothetical protein
VFRLRFALTREDFLSAVTSHAASREAAEATVTTRLTGLALWAGRPFRAAEPRRLAPTTFGYAFRVIENE